MKIVASAIGIILFIFIVLLPLLGFFVGVTTIIEDDTGKDWEGARYIDGK